MHRWAVRDSSSLVDAKPHPTILRRADNCNPPLIHSSTRPLASLTQRGIGYIRRWKLKAGIPETSLSVDAASGELEIQQPRPAHSVAWSWHRGLDLRLPMAFRFASQILSGMATIAYDRSSLSWRCGWNEMASPRTPGSSPPQGPPPWSFSLFMVSARRS